MYLYLSLMKKTEDKKDYFSGSLNILSLLLGHADADAGQGKVFWQPGLAFARFLQAPMADRAST